MLDLNRAAHRIADRAFDFAEGGALTFARTLAERALALAPRSPDAAHSLAHVYCEERDVAGGAHFLSAWLREYPPGAPEASHLACHLAQFELWTGRPTAALAVLNIRLDPRSAPNIRLRDAAAVLWRLHLAGQPHLPWQAARPLARSIIDAPHCPLDAVHAALVLAGSQDEPAFDQLASALSLRADCGDRTAATVVLPLALGLCSFAAGRFADAVRLLEPAQTRLHALGGSKVQRAIFFETLEYARRAAAPRRQMAEPAKPALGLLPSGTTAPSPDVWIALAA